MCMLEHFEKLGFKITGIDLNKNMIGLAKNLENVRKKGGTPDLFYFFDPFFWKQCIKQNP